MTSGFAAAAVLYGCFSSPRVRGRTSDACERCADRNTPPPSHTQTQAPNPLQHHCVHNQCGLLCQMVAGEKKTQRLGVGGRITPWGGQPLFGGWSVLTKHKKRVQQQANEIIVISVYTFREEEKSCSFVRAGGVVEGHASRFEWGVGNCGERCCCGGRGHW